MHTVHVQGVNLFFCVDALNLYMSTVVQPYWYVTKFGIYWLRDKTDFRSYTPFYVITCARHSRPPWELERQSRRMTRDSHHDCLSCSNHKYAPLLVQAPLQYISFLCHNLKLPINRGSYMSAHILLNLLNGLRKRDKMRGLPSILPLFHNEFNKFNNTRARMLDSIYHMTNTLKSHFWRKTL